MLYAVCSSLNNLASKLYSFETILNSQQTPQLCQFYTNPAYPRNVQGLVARKVVLNFFDSVRYWR